MKTAILKSSLTLLFVLASSSAFSAETIRIAAGASSYRNVLEKVKEPFEKATGIKVEFVPPNPLSGVTPEAVYNAVNEGRADGGTNGSNFDSLMKLLNERGVHADPKKFQYVAIGRDRVQLIVNKENGVTKLSDEQMSGILLGKIKNWKKVGGKDLPIKLAIAPGSQSGTMRMVEERALRSAKIDVKGALIAPNPAEVLKLVASTKGAVGFGAIGMVDSSVVALEHSVIGRPIILFTKGSPAPGVQKFLEFIRNEGSKLGVAR